MLLHALYIGLHAALLLSAARRNVTVAYKIPRVEKNNAIKIVTIDGRVIIFHYLLRQSQPPCSQAHTWHTQAIGLVYTAKNMKMETTPPFTLRLIAFMEVFTPLPFHPHPNRSAAPIYYLSRETINQSINQNTFL